MVYTNLGDAAKGLVDLSKAIEMTTTDKRLSPAIRNQRLAEDFFHRGVAHRLLGDNQFAMSDFSEAIRLNPKLADAYHQQGMLYMERGDRDKASGDHELAVKLNPTGRPRYDYEIDLLKDWIEYLGKIQSEDDYRNWRGPPLDLFRNAAER